MSQIRFGNRSPAEFERLRLDVRVFRDAYIGYLNDTLPIVQRGGVPPYDARRSHLLHLAVRADRAVDETGIRVSLMPLPMFGGPVISGVAVIALAHEDKRWDMRPSMFGDGEYKTSFQLVIDALDQADALLQTEEERVKRRRHSPFYWADRVLRAVLGFPAYLISLVGGFDRHDLDPGRARTLWMGSLAADVAGIYGFGRVLGWW